MSGLTLKDEVICQSSRSLGQSDFKAPSARCKGNMGPKSIIGQKSSGSRSNVTQGIDLIEYNY